MRLIMNEIIFFYFLYLAILSVRYLLVTPTIYYFLWVKKKGGFQKIYHQSLKPSQITSEMINSIPTLAFFAIGGALIQYLKKNKMGLLYTDVNDYGWGYFVFSIFIMLVLNDTFFYWTHRALHHPKLFKLIHYIHHKSVITTPFTSHSFHVIETAIEVSIVFAFPFIFPMHPKAFLIFTIIAFLYNVYGHSGFIFLKESKFTKLIPYFLNTAKLHGFHHAKNRGNFSLYFTFWDRLMGTLIEEKP